MQSTRVLSDHRHSNQPLALHGPNASRVAERARSVIGCRAMHTVRRISAALFAIAALSAVVTPAASAGPVDEVVCWVKTGDEIRCFHWGP